MRAGFQGALEVPTVHLASYETRSDSLWAACVISMYVLRFQVAGPFDFGTLRRFALATSMAEDVRLKHVSVHYEVKAGL